MPKFEAHSGKGSAAFGHRAGVRGRNQRAAPKQQSEAMQWLNNSKRGKTFAGKKLHIYKNCHRLRPKENEGRLGGKSCREKVLHAHKLLL